jgi:hypothetical protein
MITTQRTSWMIVALALVSSASAAAQAAPFGLHDGWSKREVEALAGPLSADEGKPKTYFVAHVPLAHPDLDVYAAVIGDSTGLCQVMAARLVNKSDSSAAQVSRVYGELYDQLTSKYGSASRTEPTQSRWLRISDAPLPANLEAIYLVQTAQGDAVLVSLRYRFTNYPRCLDAPAPPPGTPGKDAL